MKTALITVVELPRFIRPAAERMGEEQRNAVIASIAENPELGAHLGHGVYKARFAAKGHGKRGGVRVIYYFWDAAIPVFLLDLYAKNEKSDLTPSEKKVLFAAVDEIRKTYGGRDE